MSLSRGRIIARASEDRARDVPASTFIALSRYRALPHLRGDQRCPGGPGRCHAIVIDGDYTTADQVWPTCAAQAPAPSRRWSPAVRSRRRGYAVRPEGAAQEGMRMGGTIQGDASTRRAAGRAPVLVIGMHRSGTSLVTRLLRDLGLFIGWRLDDNAEAYLFRALNEWLLREAGATWQTPAPVRRLSGADLPLPHLLRTLARPRARPGAALAQRRRFRGGRRGKANIRESWLRCWRSACSRWTRNRGSTLHTKARRSHYRSRNRVRCMIPGGKPGSIVEGGDDGSLQAVSGRQGKGHTRRRLIATPVDDACYCLRER